MTLVESANAEMAMLTRSDGVMLLKERPPLRGLTQFHERGHCDFWVCRASSSARP